MPNIDHVQDQWLVLWTGSQPILLEGTNGMVTGTTAEFNWYLTRDDAVMAIRGLYPDWIDPMDEEVAAPA